MKIYNTVSSAYERHNFALRTDTLRVRDTAQINIWMKAVRKFRRDSILPQTKKVISSTFPDVNFSDINDKDWSISDFKNKELIINYNYLYCPPCLDKIDSTEKLISGKSILMIVLFLDIYRREITDLKPYGDNVMIGFINEDTEDLISLKQGYNSVYYLDKNRQVEFFNKLEEDEKPAWMKFLRERIK